MSHLPSKFFWRKFQIRWQSQRRRRRRGKATNGSNFVSRVTVREAVALGPQTQNLLPQSFNKPNSTRNVQTQHQDCTNGDKVENLFVAVQWWPGYQQPRYAMFKGGSHSVKVSEGHKQPQKCPCRDYAEIVSITSRKTKFNPRKQRKHKEEMQTCCSLNFRTTYQRGAQSAFQDAFTIDSIILYVVSGFGSGLPQRANLLNRCFIKGKRRRCSP